MNACLNVEINCSNPIIINHWASSLESRDVKLTLMTHFKHFPGLLPNKFHTLSLHILNILQVSGKPVNVNFR